MLRRMMVPLNQGWLFTPVPDGSGAADWQEVTLPHSNASLPASGFDEGSYAFISHYKRSVQVPYELRDSRVFVEFDGIMTAATVFMDGKEVGRHLGGYLPLRIELTAGVSFGGSNEIRVEVDSTERPDVPPFGGHIDYLTFGGIYREARLIVVPQMFIEDVFARTKDALANRRLETTIRIDAAPNTTGPKGAGILEVLLCDADEVLATGRTALDPAADGQLVTLQDGLEDATLWSLDHPRLYELKVRLHVDGTCTDEVVIRTGLREAVFTEDGFILNGERVQLRGLNRHQTFPFVGGAMSKRPQRRDAEILKHEYKCTAVRTSHYPQSPHFLDACDELGLLVFEELPGWQHIGDEAWKEVACKDVAAMVRRDRNHPSIVLWGVRINESFDDDDFYSRTNAIAHALDDSRQTTGVRYLSDSNLLEDVFSLNDFQTGGALDEPNHPKYLVSEYAGHMFPTKRFDNVERVQEHALLHARVLDTLHSQPAYSGGFGWCAFDYNTHAEFGSGDRVCYHGVADMFRIAKPAAFVYRSQCDPAETVVCEPAFNWATGDHSDYGGPGKGVILSNCDTLEIYVDDVHVSSLTPNKQLFPHLPHAPFFFDQTSGVAPWRRSWGDLRIEGYVGPDLRITRRFSGTGVDADLKVLADDLQLRADGSDTTRLVLAITDEFGNIRPLAAAAITLDVSGPLDVIGDTPVALFGGATAVWLRARQQEGTAVVRATHPRLGTRTVEIELTKAEADPW